MGRYITTTGTASSVVRVVNTTYNAQVNDRIICTAGGFTITLPNSSTCIDGDTIQILDATGIFGTNNVTMARNGTANIQNLAENLILNINNASVTLTYTVSYGWLITGK